MNSKHVSKSAAPAAPFSARGSADELALDSAIDDAMDALFESDAPESGSAALQNDGDQREVLETLASLARVHAQPLRELMFRLSVGRVPRSWASACRPLLRPLFDAASQIGVASLGTALSAFDAALGRAGADESPGAFIELDAREALQAAYARLCRELPATFSMPDQSDDRRMLLLESLLLQVPSCHRRTIARLYAAGLSTLAQLSQAQPEELSSVAGLEVELARSLVEHIRRFERERGDVDPEGLHGYIHDRLKTSVVRLAELNAEFERADREDSQMQKKSARRLRESVVLELDQLFAELGAVDLIEELKRAPVKGKIRRVQRYLELRRTP